MTLHFLVEQGKPDIRRFTQQQSQPGVRWNRETSVLDKLMIDFIHDKQNIFTAWWVQLVDKYWLKKRTSLRRLGNLSRTDLSVNEEEKKTRTNFTVRLFMNYLYKSKTDRLTWYMWFDLESNHTAGSCPTRVQPAQDLSGYPAPVQTSATHTKRKMDAHVNITIH